MSNAGETARSHTIATRLSLIGRWALVSALAMGSISVPRAAAEGARTSLRTIPALTNAEASHPIPVSFAATATYYRAYERTFFVQNGAFAIYVQQSNPVIAAPSWLSVGSLIRVIGVLLLIVLIVSVWGWTLKTKVQRLTTVLTSHAESEANMERHNAQLEHKRGRILEDINSARPLHELIEEIAELVSYNLNDAPCWCEMTDGARLGLPVSEEAEVRLIRREIPARSGGSLGTLFAAVEPNAALAPEEAAALEAGVRLATLAIETRKLYKDLVYRSEFDLLTDIYNRFSLDRYLEEQIETARQHQSIFGLIYIDLDEFKQVNDKYGHHVGDLYLQEVALRMKRQLRSGDMLARLGGDEFAALVPVVRSRSAAEEVAMRLERCFDAPFAVEGYVLRGAASVGLALYPEDATTIDSLLSAADAAMYVCKNTKRSRAEMLGRFQAAIFKPGKSPIDTHSDL